MRKFVLGFIAGVIGMLAIIGNLTMDDLEKMTSESYKKKFIDKIEYLLLGYNTRKIPPYRASYYTNYSNYRRRYQPDSDWE